MDGGYYRDQAEWCHLLLALSGRRETKEQLRLWEREFEEIAEKMETADAAGRTSQSP
jgi:hypothetical protein